MKKTIGGDRLGSGKKLQVDLHNYGRSTHDLSTIWSSTASAGTLIPFLKQLALPGDSWDINLDCEVMTHPTVGPLFGSFKVQLDVFLCPIRLYQRMLHNNELGIGLKMNTVALPYIQMSSLQINEGTEINDIDNAQTNPSSIFAYLGIRGAGRSATVTPFKRNLQVVPWISYWDIYKNYYANKQEEIGYVIHTPRPTIIETIDGISIGAQLVSEYPLQFPIPLPVQGGNTTMYITYIGLRPNLATVMLNFTTRGQVPVETAFVISDEAAGTITLQYKLAEMGADTLISWQYIDPYSLTAQEIELTQFDLSNIDLLKKNLLAAPGAFEVNTQEFAPYNLILDGAQPSLLSSQEGLAIKTYQSDLLNNWIQTEWIDGDNGINEITKVDTTSGGFTIDSFMLAKKVYDMLNRIAISGGSYDDWLDAVYTHDRYTRVENPMYMGGLIKELIFQEVVSNTESASGETPVQPLGTLAGKGRLGKKHKGGEVTIKVDEPSYIMGIFSLTPRVTYSQGNDWDIHLLTLDDLHKPGLDEIGFQELIVEQMAWWDTEYNGSVWETHSAGKQPAWINYMTNINKAYGNFAIRDNEMFMTLNRRYDVDVPTLEIKDVTTYIDPRKYNHIFADTALDAQNFWVQIACDITARRKMSAKIMPNL